MMEALLPEMRYAPDGRVAVRRPGQFDEWVVVAGPDSSWAADVRPGADDVEAWTKFPSPAEVARLGADLVEIRAALVAADPKSELAGYEHVRTVDIARAIVDQRDEAREALKYADAHYETLKGDFGRVRRQAEENGQRAVDEFEARESLLLELNEAQAALDTLRWLHAEAVWHAEHHRVQADTHSLALALQRAGFRSMKNQVDAMGRKIREQDQQLALAMDTLGSIWLYVNWRYITGKLTTEQRELWADAVDAFAEPQPGKAERWWRDDAPAPQHDEVLARLRAAMRNSQQSEVSASPREEGDGGA